MNYADAVEMPIIVKIGEKDVALKPLTQRDYLPWLAELTEQMKEKDRKLVPPAMKAVEKFELTRRIEMSEVIPADLEPRVFTAMGTVKVLQLALIKAGLGEDAADKFIDSRPLKANEELAVRVSGLFTQAQIASHYGPRDPEAEKPDPNELPPVATTGGNTTIGASAA